MVFDLGCEALIEGVNSSHSFPVNGMSNEKWFRLKGVPVFWKCSPASSPLPVDWILRLDRPITCVLSKWLM